MKKPKWKIGICVQKHYIIDVQSANEQDAIDSAIDSLSINSEYYETSKQMLVTSVFINDKDSSQFFKFVPELYPVSEEEE